MNRQLESQEVAVHSNKVRIIKETFLANGHVDKTDLPPLEVMFERAIAAEQLLQQLHHGTLMRTANSARYADRRDDPHVMAVLREPPPTLGVQFPLQQHPTPRNPDTDPTSSSAPQPTGTRCFSPSMPPRCWNLVRGCPSTRCTKACLIHAHSRIWLPIRHCSVLTILKP